MSSKSPWIWVLGLTIIIIVAVLVRLPSLWAGYPHLNYVDEGLIIQTAVTLLHSGGWDPGYYGHPTLPIYAIAVAAHLYSPLSVLIHGDALTERLSEPHPSYWDIVEPPELLIVARLVTLLTAIGIVVLTGLLAKRVAGTAAGLLAAWIAALLPALVIRSSVIEVDSYVTFFVLAALFFAHRAMSKNKPLLDATLSGCMIGLAFASKYPAALVSLAVGIQFLMARTKWGVKTRMLILSAFAAILSSAVAMPALILRTSKVLAYMHRESRIYSWQVVGSFWDQAVRRAEWDQPLDYPELGYFYLGLTAVGFLVAIKDKSLRKTVGAWLLYGAASLVLFSQFQFKAFRNLLPLVPLSCMVVAFLLVRVRRSLPRPRMTMAACLALFPLLFLAPDFSYLRNRLECVDSRVEALRWLDRQSGGQDTIVIQKELAFLPSELEQLGIRASTIEWPMVLDYIASPLVDFLVAGKLVSGDGKTFDAVSRELIGEFFELRTQFGENQTSLTHANWRGNRQTIYIFENKARKSRQGHN